MKRTPYMVILVLVTFFVISFLTNVLGPLIPDIIDNFNLSLGLAGFLPFSFFVAYGVMSIPAGILAEKYTEKPVLIAAFVLAFCGALLFAMFPRFRIALISLFLIGIGMAMLAGDHQSLAQGIGWRIELCLLFGHGTIDFRTGLISKPSAIFLPGT